MPKHTVYTVVTPLPTHITRANVISFLHEHTTMIDLNPLVESRTLLDRPPAKASPDEYAQAQWYELVDRISFLPRGLYTGKVVYHVSFHDLPDGVQTHCYAPMGLDIKERWSVGGFEPGEVRTNQPLGLGVPKDGSLYIREDVDMSCRTLLNKFVRKNLDNAHKVLVARLVEKAANEEVVRYNRRLMTSSTGTSLADVEKSSVASAGPSNSINSIRSLATQGTIMPHQSNVEGVAIGWPLPNIDLSPMYGSAPTSPLPPTPTTQQQHQQVQQAQQGYYTAPTSPVFMAPTSQERSSPPLPFKNASRVASISPAPVRAPRRSSEMTRPAPPELVRSPSERALRQRAASTSAKLPPTVAAAIAAQAQTSEAQPTFGPPSPPITALPPIGHQHSRSLSQKFHLPQQSSQTQSPPQVLPQANSSAARSTSTNPTQMTNHIATPSASSLGIHPAMRPVVLTSSADSSPTLGKLSVVPTLIPASKQDNTRAESPSTASSDSSATPSTGTAVTLPTPPISTSSHFSTASLQDKPAPWDQFTQTTTAPAAEPLSDNNTSSDNLWIRPKEIGVAVGGVDVGGMDTVWEDREKEREMRDSLKLAAGGSLNREGFVV